MAEYTSLIATGQRLIKKRGQSVTWRQIVNGDPGDPAKPWLATDSVNTDYPVNMAFIPANRENKYLVERMDGMTAKTGQLLGLMGQVTTFTPKAKDIVIRNGLEYSIETIDTIEPNNEGAILYIFELATGGQGN